jgi:hypothetical protein
MTRESREGRTDLEDSFVSKERADGGGVQLLQLRGRGRPARLQHHEVEQKDVRGGSELEQAAVVSSCTQWGVEWTPLAVEGDYRKELLASASVPLCRSYSSRLSPSPHEFFEDHLRLPQGLQIVDKDEALREVRELQDGEVREG